MRVSINWLKELVGLKISLVELIILIPMRTIGLKETNEDFLELDMKGYNRADLLSVRGVAREIAAITDSKVNFSDKNPEDFIWASKNLPQVNIQIENKQLCPVYCVAKIEGLKVEKSTPEIAKKLNDSEIRSIDNITDITNLMMMEYGQTMHSFDAAKVDQETMIVRLAKEGEQFATLDGKNRILTQEDLLITDPKGILSLSGIMGGKDSEITENTDTILLEVAIFDPVSIRKSSQRFDLYSEASKRIQHGLTKTNLLQALDAAIRMYERLGGKLTAISLVGDLEDKPQTVNLRLEKVNSLIGIEFTQDQIEQLLQKLGFTTERVGANVIHPEGGIAWHVIPPYWRLDINIEEDLIEEVARIYGYEKIPAKELEGMEPEKIDQSLFDTIWSLKKALSEAGLTEVQTYSFYSTDVLNNLSWNKESLVKVANPISSETEYLREDIWPNLLEVAVKNVRQGYKDIGIFEIGKVYGKSENGTPAESYRVSLCLANTSDNTIQELYQIFQNVIPLKNGIQLNTQSEMGKYEQKYFHPARFGYLDSRRSLPRTPIRGGNDEHVGGIAEIHPRYTDKFGIKQRVAVLEFELSSVLNNR